MDKVEEVNNKKVDKEDKKGNSHNKKKEVRKEVEY